MDGVADVLKPLARYDQHLIDRLLRSSGILPDHEPQRLELDDQGRETMTYTESWMSLAMRVRSSKTAKRMDVTEASCSSSYAFRSSAI